MTAETRGSVIVPTVHLNGTSKKELIKQLTDVQDNIRVANLALRETEIALGQATPHDRDYYVQGAIVGHEARRQHGERRHRILEMKEQLSEMYFDILKIVEGIKEQGGE